MPETEVSCFIESASFWKNNDQSNNPMMILVRQKNIQNKISN